jgi:hypothetical protein
MAEMMPAQRMVSCSGSPISALAFGGGSEKVRRSEGHDWTKRFRKIASDAWQINALSRCQELADNRCRQ